MRHVVFPFHIRLGRRKREVDSGSAEHKKAHASLACFAWHLIREKDSAVCISGALCWWGRALQSRAPAYAEN